MKQKIVLFSSLFFIVACGVIYFSCNKQEIMDDSNLKSENELVQKTADDPGGSGTTTPCCEASCRRGACKAYTSPCNCTCIGGQPSCGGLTTGGGTGNIITSDPAQMASYDNLASYIQNELNDAMVAEAVIAIKQLFENNDFKLESQELVDLYYEYLTIYVDFYNNQSQEIQSILEDL